MKLIIFLLFGLLLTSCAPAPVPVTGTASPTLTEPVPPQTLPPSATPPPTQTPLPTIPTFTPTFDARQVVTVTPAAKAECPAIVHLTNPNLEFLNWYGDKPENGHNVEKNLLDSLNKFGGASLYKAIKPMRRYKNVVLQDLTNDGQPEFAIGVIAFYIFGCQNGRYIKLLELEPDGYLHHPSITAIQDINHNGIRDITFVTRVLSQGGHSYAIYEWNGVKFANLIHSNSINYPDAGEIWAEATGRIHYENIDHDLMQELILDSGIPVWETYNSGLPWRNKQTIYKWNGQYYLPTKSNFAEPEFRFQAIQDGDLALIQQEYAKALMLYQKAIFNEQLKDYSPEILKNLKENWRVHFDKEMTPTPAAPDPTEYPRLAAYAYYRMMILHTHLGETDVAQTQFATLKAKFPAGNPGHPYTEMASDFWAAYQATGKMYKACAAAIAFADAHPEILVPLGSGYHGWQSHTYTPADVCLFR